MPIPSLTHCHSEICFVPTGQGTMQPSDYFRTYQQEMTGLHETDGLTITKYRYIRYISKISSTYYHTDFDFKKNIIKHLDHKIPGVFAPSVFGPCDSSDFLAENATATRRAFDVPPFVLGDRHHGHASELPGGTGGW